MWQCVLFKKKQRFVQRIIPLHFSPSLQLYRQLPLILSHVWLIQCTLHEYLQFSPYEKVHSEIYDTFFIFSILNFSKNTINRLAECLNVLTNNVYFFLRNLKTFGAVWFYLNDILSLLLKQANIVIIISRFTCI